MRFYLLVALVSASVTGVLAFIIYRLSNKYRLYPAIRARDVHTKPTPRLGGAAMFFGVLVAVALASNVSWFRLVFVNPGPIWAIIGAAFIVVVIGVADDIWDLDWTIKLAGQILAALLLAWQGVQILSLPIGGRTIGSSGMSLILTVVTVVLVMNAVNFIDGLDGLVAGVALITNGVFFLYSYFLVQRTSPTDYFNFASLITAVLLGACLGFLPFNWHPAKLFMGDAGAMLVGLLMAASAIAVTGQVDPDAIGRSELFPAFIPILLPFAVLILPLLDFSLAIFRRLRAGKSPFTADRKHLHHRLLDMGHSHFHAVLIFYAWTLVASVGCLLFFVLQPFWLAIIFLAVGMLSCTILTLAPLTKRKALEASIQRAPQESLIATHTARLDPLDAASDDEEV